MSSIFIAFSMLISNIFFNNQGKNTTLLVSGKVEGIFRSSRNEDLDRKLL